MKIETWNSCFFTDLSQKVLKDIKKSFEIVHLDAKIYSISPASLKFHNVHHITEHETTFFSAKHEIGTKTLYFSHPLLSLKLYILYYVLIGKLESMYKYTLDAFEIVLRYRESHDRSNQIQNSNLAITITYLRAKTLLKSIYFQNKNEEKD